MSFRAAQKKANLAISMHCAGSEDLSLDSFPAWCSSALSLRARSSLVDSIVSRLPEFSPVCLLVAGIDLENIVYYKDDTHYFVMTAKKQSLLDKGVILNVSNGFLSSASLLNCLIGSPRRSLV